MKSKFQNERSSTEILKIIFSSKTAPKLHFPKNGWVSKEMLHSLENMDWELCRMPITITDRNVFQVLIYIFLKINTISYSSTKLSPFVCIQNDSYGRRTSWLLPWIHKNGNNFVKEYDIEVIFFIESTLKDLTNGDGNWHLKKFLSPFIQENVAFFKPHSPFRKMQFRCPFCWKYELEYLFVTCLI